LTHSGKMLSRMALGLLSYFKKSMQESFVFFLLMSVLFIYPVFLDSMLYFREAGVLGCILRVLGIFTLGCSVACIISIIVTLCNNISKVLGHVAVVFFVTSCWLLSITETILIRLFNSRYSAFVFQLIQFTNKQETSEFLKTYIQSVQLWIIVVVYSTTLLIALLGEKYVYQRAKDGFKKVIHLVTIIVFILGVPSFCRDLLYKDSISFIIKAGKEYKALQEEVNICKQHAGEFLIDTCTFKSSNIVLVIGESYNRHHSGIYGYHLETTPYLSQLENVFVFKYVIAPINSTHIQFQNFLSMHSVDDSTNWNTTALLPAIFKRAGYEVFFYSNQYPKRDIVTDAWEFKGMFMDDSQIDSLCFDHRNTMTFNYDADFVVSCNEQYQEQKNSHNLVIYHLMGQHVDPVKRFPASFAHFSVDDEDRPNLSVKQRQQVADYDNATLYNDYVVSLIINQFANEDAIVIFFADHGDEVNDFRPHIGRSMDFAAGEEVAHNQLDIPFIIYMSAEYKRSHLQEYNDIITSLNKPFMVDDLPHLLLGLAGIQSEQYNPRRDLLSIEFDSSRKRCVGRDYEFDYDSICR